MSICRQLETDQNPALALFPASDRALTRPGSNQRLLCLYLANILSEETYASIFYGAGLGGQILLSLLRNTEELLKRPFLSETRYCQGDLLSVVKDASGE